MTGRENSKLILWTINPQDLFFINIANKVLPDQDRNKILSSVSEATVGESSWCPN